MDEKPSITAQVKAMRKAAGIGVRPMARALKWKPGTYQYYEDEKDGYKGEFLPQDVALAIAEVLVPLGIPRARVMSLAGMADQAPPAKAPLSEETGQAIIRAVNDSGRAILEAVNQLRAELARSPPQEREGRGEG